MRIERARLVDYRLPLITPVVTRHGSVHERRGVLVVLTDDEGRTGFGDTAPWPGLGPSLREVKSAVAGAMEPRSPLRERTFEAVADVEALLASVRLPAEAAHGIEGALLDVLGQAQGVPVAKLLAPAPRAVLELHALVVDATQARTAIDGGARTLKVKVGATSPRDDEARLQAVRAEVGPEIELRLDANGAWDFETAYATLSRWRALDIAFVEEPLRDPDPASLAELRRRTGVRLAVDESVVTLATLERVLDAKAVDVVVVKPMRVGGLLTARRLAARAAAAGLPVVVTSVLESAVGRMGAAHLAASAPGALLACGLAPSSAEDVVPPAPPGYGGTSGRVSYRLSLPTVAGLGVDPMLWTAAQWAPDAEGERPRKAAR